jgi:hypothetical protein
MARRKTTAGAAGANKKQTGARKTVGDSAEMREKTSTGARKRAAGSRTAAKKR